MKLAECRWNLWNIVSGNRKVRERVLNQEKAHLQSKIKHAKTMFSTHQSEDQQKTLRELYSRLQSKQLKGRTE